MTEAEIDELLKNTNDLLANENLQSEEEKPEGTPDLVNQIDTAIEPPKQEEQVKEELPKATPSPLPSPVATPPKEPELDLNKPSNVVLSILGDRDQEDFDAADLELIDGLEDGKDLYELSKARPDISLNTDQARKIFEYQRTASPYTKVPENAADWYNLTDAALEDVGDVLSMTGEMVWGGMKGAAKAVQYGTPALLGMNSTYAEALALEKKLPPEKRGEVEAWRKRAWQIASTPLKGGEQPSPDSYTDEKYLQKVKENLPPEKATEAQKTEQEFQEKRYKAKQVPYSILDELAGLPISLNFLGTKVGTGGMQTWDNISEKFGLQDKEKSFENWLARNEIDTAQAKMMKAEPRAFARVVQTYYAPAMKSFTNLLHPSVKEYMIMYPELSMEEAQAKRAEQIDSDVQTTIEDIKKDIPETDPDQAMFGSLAIPGQFGLDNFGFAYNVLSATKQLTPLVRTKLRQMRYTDDQINAFEKQAQQALRAKELKRLEKLEKPGMVERAAGATAKGIEKAGDYFERSPTWQKIGKATPVVSGAMLGYQLDPENPLQSLAVGSLGGAVGIPVAKQTLKTITEIPKSIKEISAARRISAGGAQGPLATLKTIAQQQDEVKTLSAKLKTYAEGTDDYIETEKLLKDAKDKLKGIKAGGTDVIDYQGIGKVSDTTKRILRFVNDDMVSNIGEYAKLGIEPTLVGLATGIIDSSDEEELKTMIGQGLAFSLGGRAVQQSFNKFIGEDPVIAARKSRQANVDAFKAYRDSSPETRGEIDQLTDWDNVINRQTTKAEKAQIALQELQAKGADPAKIAEAEKAATAEQKSLSLLKTANVQTRNEFGRQFLQQLGRNNMLLNGSLKAGQNNVGFHILSTQQIFDHFRKNPAFANVPDDVILTYAGQSGFYSGGGQQGESNMAFDPAKPAIVLNSDALRNRMEVFGETPIDALNHETGHHISRVPEIQDALGDVRKILFTNEIKDASGLTKTITNGLYTNDQLVDLFDSQYLKNRSKQEKEQIAKSLGLWDSGLNQLDRENVKNYMQEEILAEVFSNTLSRNLGKNIDDKQIHLLDFARLKLKNNLLKKAAVKMLGLGMDGNVESAVTGAQITPEAQSAARNALRIMQSMNGDFSTITSQPDVPAISKADIKKSRVAAERYGMDSGLFETKTIAQVFDAAGKPIGDAVEITDPAVFEGSWRVGKDGEERLSGYGQIPIELRQLQVPEGGTLSISKQLQTEADGVTPKMLEKGELAKRIKNRAELFKKAIDTPDYGTPGRFEPVYEGSETYRGSFTPMQIQAIKELPEGIVPLKIKKYLLELNDAIVRKDGTRFFVDYAAVMDDKGNYKAFSPKIYDVVPIGLQLSSAGNFLVTTISVGRMREKLNLWADRMPGRLSPWNGSKEAFWQDFSKKYLANWAAQIEGSGYKNGVPVGNNQLDPDYQKAEEKKSILNDYLNLFTNETRPLNLDRTQIPRKQGDPKNKSADRTIMSMRVDHFAELLSGEHLPKLPIDYGKAIINFLPASAEIEAPSGERGFQSKLQTEIQRKFQGANATPEQLKAVLGNPQNVKAEEVKWSGVMDEIDRLAQENNGKVPVQQLVNYLRDEGQVKFEEVNIRNISYSDVPQDYVIQRQEELLREAADAAALEDDSDPEFAYDVLSKNAGILRDFAEQARDEYIDENQKGLPRYFDHQLPGGKNYREVVLSMPFSKKGNDLSEKVRIETTENYKGEPIYIIYGPSERFGGEARMSGEFSNLENAQKAFEKIKLKFIGKKESFTSSHFPDVPNYIAHMRLNERTDAEGNQGLFVEEFQSDRHQQGREKGYREDIPKPDTSKWRASKDGIEPTQSDRWRVYSPDNPMGALFTANSAEEAISRASGYYGLEGIPDAPFRKDWGVQLFKRALRDAVESGKSWIGWTTGIEQVNRYENDMRSKVDEITWQTINGDKSIRAMKYNNVFFGGAIDKDGNIRGSGTEADGKQVSDVFGKAIASKVSEDYKGSLAGDDLTVGGEGMKGFYDTILPKEIGKYVSKMGGKVEKSGIITERASTFTQFIPPRRRTPNAVPKTTYIPEKVTPIWRVNITPEMANVVSAGQIQFMPAVEVEAPSGERERARFLSLELDRMYAAGGTDKNINAYESELEQIYQRLDSQAEDRETATEDIVEAPETTDVDTMNEPTTAILAAVDDYNSGRVDNQSQTLAQHIRSTVDSSGALQIPENVTDQQIEAAANDVVQYRQSLKDRIRSGTAFSNAVVAPAGIQFLPAWHGSPFDFDKFSFEKIGEGEGQQAFGWGGYFAGLRQVGEGYQAKLARDIKVDGVVAPNEAIIENQQITDLLGILTDALKVRKSGMMPDRKNIDRAIRMLENEKEASVDNTYAEEVLNWWFDAGIKGLKDPSKIQSGTLYKVDIDVEDGDLLDWDKPLSEQNKKIQDAVLPTIIDQFDKIKKAREHIIQRGTRLGGRPFRSGELEQLQKPMRDPLSLTGRDAYVHITNAFGGRPSEDAPKASKFLLEQGVPGIRYWDAFSRGVGEGTSNYVIFDDKLIKILEKDDKPVGPVIQFMPAEGESAMPSEQPQGMEGVEMPQTYRRISGMIPPLQGVEPPVAPSALPAEPETPATPSLPKQVEKTMKADAGDFSVVIGGKPGKYGFEYTSVAKLQPELELSEQRKKDLLETLTPRNEEFNKKRDALMEIGNLWWENNDLLNKQNKSDEDRSRMKEVDQFLQEFMAKDDKEFAIDDAIQVAQVDRLTKRINELQRGITPAPFKFPADRETALKSLQSAVATLFKTKKFKQFVASAAGLEGINFDNILGTWKFEAEPSFVFSAPGMTWDQAQTITKWLSVLMTQDAGIAWKPSIGLTEGAPSVYLVHNKKLTEDQILKAFEKAKQVGIDGLSVTVDGKGIKAANFDGIEGFYDKLGEIQKSAGIKNFHDTLVDSFYYDTTSDFTAEDGSTKVPDWLKGTSINEKNIQDQQGRGEETSGIGREYTITGGLSVLLRGGIDSVLVPYAKALAGEGFTFDPNRFAERYGLGQEVADYIREQLYPATGLSRSVTPILEGTEKFVVPESFYTKDGKLKTSVNDLMYALQRRSADDGFIVPGDYSPRAGQIISETIVDEVVGHMERAKQNPDAPNAIGWYDAALKRMKAEYAKYFPFLNRESKDYNADKEFVFDSVLGITSQGNNVFENGKMAARIQFLLENGKTLPEIASEEFLYDTFGGQTRAIENNLLKLDELLKNNDTQTLDKIFRKKMTVSEWNAYLKKNKNFYFKGEPLSVDGQADQMVTGFSVFGPKIGSFINNLHGDYSTLTADLWYTRTWNRILGNVFQHASLKEANQYDTFRKALLEQYRKNKTESYQRKFNPLVKKINKEGKKVLFDYLNETELEGLSENEFGELINDPQRMLDFATALEDRFRSGQYKTKSDLRRAAKNWVENRSDPVAAPRTDLERDFQQNVMEIAQKKLRRKGINISIADMQAALWYNEKELFGLYGAQVSGAEPADYADSAENVSELMSYGTLFQLERLVDQQDGTKKKEIIRLVPYDAELGLTKIKDAKTPEEYAQLVAARKKAIEDAKNADKKLEKAELKVEETRNQLAKVDPTDQKSKQKAEVALAKAEKLLADLKPPVATPVAPLTGIKSPVE